MHNSSRNYLQREKLADIKKNQTYGVSSQSQWKLGGGGNLDQACRMAHSPLAPQTWLEHLPQSHTHTPKEKEKTMGSFQNTSTLAANVGNLEAYRTVAASSYPPLWQLAMPSLTFLLEGLPRDGNITLPLQREAIAGHVQLSRRHLHQRVICAIMQTLNMKPNAPHCPNLRPR